MKYYKFLLTMLIASMLCISFTAVTGTQIPNFSAEKLKINDSIRFTNPGIMNKFDEVFKSLLNKFIKIIPDFIITMFFSQNNKDFNFVNEINKVDNSNNQEEDNIVNNIEKITINNKEEIIIIDEINNIISEDINHIFYNDNIEEEVNDREENQKNENELELTLELEQEYRLGEPISVTAILTNNVARRVFLSEMDVKLMTLDFLIETPFDFTIHYIGPLEGEAEIIKLDSFQSIFSEINLASTNVTFGEKKPGLTPVHSPYKFSSGEYTIQGVYISDYLETWDHSDYWQGVLISPIYEFSIKSD